ncbi:MAG TPA: anti-sigma factor [Luteimonas sp.]|nr:anti-sigma factor [Luteimonas sp.]
MNTVDPSLEADGDAPPGDAVLAGEYVLGVLDGATRREVEARMASEPEFAAHVSAWERHFSVLADEIEPEEVPTHVWPRIRTTLGWPAAGDAARVGLWHSTPFWRGATALAAGIALVAVFGGRVPETTPPPTDPVVQAPPAPQPEPAVAGAVTTLARDDGSAGWLATVDVARGAVLMVPVPVPADPSGRVAELWVIPADGTPRSLGLISTSQTRTVTVPDALRDALAPGSTLAVTLEPRGGAPDGVPTGPIVAKGGIVTI